MRHRRGSHIPPTRRQLAFEPLEPRALLAADVDAAWASYWNQSPADDWSWTFADDSINASMDGGGWGDDSWWVSDVSWDVPAGGEADSGGSWGDDSWWFDDATWNVPANNEADLAADIGTGIEAASSDWSEAVGSATAGWTIDFPSPPAANADTDEPEKPMVPVIVDAPSALLPTVGVVSPAQPPMPAVSVVDLPDDDMLPAEETAELPADDTVELPVDLPAPIVVTADGDATVDVAGDWVWNLTAIGVDKDADVAADWVFEPDMPIVAACPAPVVPDNIHEFTTIFVRHEDPPGLSSVLDVPGTFSGPSPLERLPPEPAAAVGEIIVVDDFGSPTIVVATAAAAVRPSATGIDFGRFAAWAAGFPQAFSRPAGDADGSLSGPLGAGQTGTGRPRGRLPFRPIA